MKFDFTEYGALNYSHESVCKVASSGGDVKHFRLIEFIFCGLG